MRGTAEGWTATGPIGTWRGCCTSTRGVRGSHRIHPAVGSDNVTRWAEDAQKHLIQYEEHTSRLYENCAAGLADAHGQSEQTQMTLGRGPPTACSWASSLSTARWS